MRARTPLENVTSLVQIAAAVGGLWIAWKVYEGGKEGSFDPRSDNNLLYRQFDERGPPTRASPRGEVTSSLGTRIYDATHPFEPDPTSPRRPTLIERANPNLATALPFPFNVGAVVGRYITNAWSRR